jgi:hypothetical protein
MNQEVFSVYDSVAERYLEPFFSPNVGTATRSFSEACRKQDHQFAKYPEDYSLFHIGTFNAETGLIESFTSVHPLGSAAKYVESSNG